MKKARLAEVEMTKEEYLLLKDCLAKHGINVLWSSTDGNTYNCYFRNPYQEAIALYGNDIAKEQAKEYYDRYERF